MQNRVPPEIIRWCAERVAGVPPCAIEVTRMAHISHILLYETLVISATLNVAERAFSMIPLCDLWRYSP